MDRITATVLSSFVAAATVGCHVAPQKAATSPESPEVPLHCQGLMIPVGEAQRLMEGCQVVSLGQPHQGPVILTLRDGSRACFFQPRPYWVIAKANQVCPDSPIRMTVE